MRHPALVLLIAWIAVLGADRVRQRVGWSNARAGRHILVGVGIAILAAYCSVVLWYARQMAYFDPAEPTITAVASVFNAGKPLYPSLDDPERYAHVYGPLLFMVHAGVLSAIGPSILSSKAVGATAVLVSLVLGFALFARRSGPLLAIVATSACALVYMAFGNVTFWTRSDPLLILCVVVALGASPSSSWQWPALLMGLTMGIAVNLKLTGPLYLLPVLATVTFTHGLRAMIGAIVVAAPVAIAPYLIPQVSLPHYWDYFELSARNGIVAATLRRSVEWVIFLCAPLVAALWPRRVSGQPPERSGRIWIALAAGFSAVTLASAKPGGGPFHLLPFVPILADELVRIPTERWRRPVARTVAVAFGIAAFGMGISSQAVFFRTVAARDLAPAVADVRQFVEAHPTERVAVGYAGTSYLSHARPEAVFRSGDYLLDAPAVQEHRLSGLALPASTIKAIENCRVGYWLVPRDGQPFVVPNAYLPAGPPDVFPVEFRDAFLRRHTRTGSIGGFDVWQCRADAAIDR